MHGPAPPFFLLRINCYRATLLTTIPPGTFPLLRKLLPQSCKAWSKLLNNLLNLGILLEQVYLFNVPRKISCNLNILQVIFLFPHAAPSFYFSNGVMWERGMLSVAFSETSVNVCQFCFIIKYYSIRISTNISQKTILKIPILFNIQLQKFT